MAFRTAAVAGALALGALAAGAAPAGAEADHSQTLRTLCEASEGTFVPHPFFWRARCQGARPSGGAEEGLRAEGMMCIMQMAGTFSYSVVDDDGSTSWVCL